MKTALRALLALLVLALALTAGPATEAAPAVRLNARIGFDGVGKIGHWLPVEVEVVNEGSDLDAVVEVEVRDTQNRGVFTRAPSVYTVAAPLPRRAHKRFTLDVLLQTTTNRVFARLVQGKEVIAEQEVQLSRVPAGELLCGVMSRQPSAFEFIPATDLAGPQRRARTVPLLPEELPSKPQLLTAFDCLVVHNVSTGLLSAEQKDALTTWVRAGGLLIAVGGPGWQKTLAPLPPELLPVRVSGLVELEALDALAKFTGLPLEASGPWLVSEATLHDGVAVVSQNGLPILAAGRRGAGTVFYLALDPASEPLKGWIGQTFLWRSVLAYAPAPSGVGSVVARPYAGWGRFPRLAMSDLSALDAPSADWLQLPLVLLAALLGPLNYFTLRRLGKPGWAAWTTPAIIALIGVWTFAGAAVRREGDLVISTITLLRTPDPETTGYSRSYVSLVSRGPVTADLRTEDAALPFALFYPFPRDGSDPEMPGWRFVTEQSERPTIAGFELPPSSLGTFLVDGRRRLDGLRGEFRLDDQRLIGTVRNGLGAAITDAAIILDNRVTRIGDLAPGEAREVQIEVPAAATVGYGLPNSFSTSLYPAGQPERKQRDPARRDILDAVFTTSIYASRMELSGPTLVGWLEAPGLELAPRGLRPGRVDQTLIVSSFPVELPRGERTVVPPALIARRHLTGVAPTRQQFGSYDLQAGEAVLLQYTLPAPPSRFTADELLVNVEGRFVGLDGRFRTQGQPAELRHDIAVYNWRTTEWVDLVVGNGASRLPDPAELISATGEVRLRYTLRSGAGPSAVSLSRLDLTVLGLAL